MMSIFAGAQTAFWIASAAIILLMTKGTSRWGVEQFAHTKLAIMPFYLLLCGIMIGYLLVALTLTKNEVDIGYARTVLLRGWMIGLGLGAVLALLYLFV